MDLSADINSITDTAFQRALSGLPPLGASTEQGTSRAICIAGIPVISISILLAALRPLFTPLGINVDKLLEQTTDVQEAQTEDDAAPEPKFKCPICMGAYVRPTALKVCGHVFCGSCIAQAFAKQKKCPTCRTKATKRHLLKIYLS